MTVRYAYYKPGSDEPTYICDTMEQVHGLAAQHDDEYPRTKPVTLGALNTPSPDHIADAIFDLFVEMNPPWMSGFQRYQERMRNHILTDVAGLASKLADWTRRNPGYVVDERDLEQRKLQTGERVIHTGDVK